jgi:hypothetical protein
MTNNKHGCNEGVLFHVGVILMGSIMTVLGLGLGVTMVLLPVGIPVGLLGLLLVIWGLTPGSWTS